MGKPPRNNESALLEKDGDGIRFSTISLRPKPVLCEYDDLNLQQVIQFPTLELSAFIGEDGNSRPAGRPLIFKTGQNKEHPVDLTLLDDQTNTTLRKRRRSNSSSCSRPASRMRSKVKDLSIQRSTEVTTVASSNQTDRNNQVCIVLPEDGLSNSQTLTSLSSMPSSRSSTLNSRIVIPGGGDNMPSLVEEDVITITSDSEYEQLQPAITRRSQPKKTRTACKHSKSDNDRSACLQNDIRLFGARELARWKPVDSIRFNGYVVSCGSQVQLKPRHGRHFLGITSVGHLEGSHDLYILGKRFDDLRHLGISERDRYNEICLIQRISDYQEVPDSWKNLFITSASHILRLVSISLTNEPKERHPEPDMRLNNMPSWICRLKRVAILTQDCIFENEDEHDAEELAFWEVDDNLEGAIVFLSFEDCDDDGCGRILSDKDIESDFRGPLTKGGSTRIVTLDEADRYRIEEQTAESTKRALGDTYNPEGIWANQERHRPESATESHTRRESSPSVIAATTNNAADLRSTASVTARAVSNLSHMRARYSTNPRCSGSIIFRETLLPLHTRTDTISSIPRDRFAIDTTSFLQRQGDIVASRGRSNPRSIRRYTFGDAFCGAGGMTRGVVEAGACPVWAFDIEKPMCEVYTINFPWVQVANMAAYDFITDGTMDRKVDLLHLSPPCKFYSPAHTINCESDGANIAASFAVAPLLEKTKPRIVTLEQTVGLTYTKHRNFFQAIIREFLSCGYSVRWKVLRMADFGVPQSRKRLIILASCPGEPLPPFPTQTHHDPSSNIRSQGSRPWNHVSEAIEGTISFDHPHHNINAAILPGGERLVPFNGAIKLAGTLTCKGGNKNYHPSGRRHYTVQELAMLQTFPVWHSFAQPTIRANGRAKDHIVKTKTQIGNAVPPLFAKTLYEHLIRWLRRVDGVSSNQIYDAR